MTQRGFTLIELVVVFTIMAILSTLAIASFVSYGRSQSLEKNAQDVYTTLITARSKAQTQVKPSGCTDSDTLAGYRVDFTDIRDYSLRALCGEKAVLISANHLSSDTRFANVTTFTFQVLTGTTQNDGVIVVQNTTGGKKMINICPDGRVIIDTPSMTLSSSSVTSGATIKVNWCGVSNDLSTTWIGLYPQGAADTGYVMWLFLNNPNCSNQGGNGVCSFQLAPGLTTGTYEFRMFKDGGYSLLTTSPPFTFGN